MTDFHTTTTPKARKAHTCPECGTTIQPGERYARMAGSYDGDFVSAIQCEPCRAFGDRYLTTLTLSACLNWDEKTYQFGDMLNEAAEFLGFLWDDGHDRMTRPQRRDAMMAMFDDADKAERAEQKRERELLRVARDRAATMPPPPQRYVATGKRP